MDYYNNERRGNPKNMFNLNRDDDDDDLVDDSDEEEEGRKSIWYQLIVCI